jgi:Arc/MetJ-type ribon-helix-helix transcriptional regulator
MSQLSDQIQKITTTETAPMTSIAIPKDVYLRVEKRLQKADFKSVGEYVTYVLEQVLIELEGKDAEQDPKKDSDNPFSKEDQENVEQKLRDLGYL